MAFCNFREVFFGLSIDFVIALVKTHVPLIHSTRSDIIF